MDWKDLLNAALSAGVSGAVAAILPLVGTTPINWSAVGIAAATGALIGIVNHFRTPPGKIATPK